MSKVSTGVGGIFSAAHRDITSGQLHGHTWEVTAWFDGGGCAVQLQHALSVALSEVDHTLLPENLAWGEEIAAWVGDKLKHLGCIRVDVSRPLERIFARCEL